MSKETHNQDNSLEQRTETDSTSSATTQPTSMGQYNISDNEKRYSNHTQPKGLLSWIGKHPTLATAGVALAFFGGIYGLSQLNGEPEGVTTEKKKSEEKKKTIDKVTEASAHLNNTTDRLNQTYESEFELRAAFYSDYNEALSNGVGASALSKIRQAYRNKAKNDFKAQ